MDFFTQDRLVLDFDASAYKIKASSNEGASASRPLVLIFDPSDRNT